MPEYNYKCSKCGNIDTVSKKMSEEVKVICCNKEMKRVYTPNPIIFKGTGWTPKGG